MKSFFRSVLITFIAFYSLGAAAGGAGVVRTNCQSLDLKLDYVFVGYAQDLTVGKTLKLYSLAPNSKQYGVYQVDFIDLSLPVGIIELSHKPTVPPKNLVDTDFGKMKIEYFSDSTFRDIKVTLTKGGADTVGNVVCLTND